MRIQMIAIGSTGDVQPIVVLGKELSSRGHQVSVAAFSALAPLVKGAGLSFLSLPGDAGRYIGNIIRPGANPLTYLSRMESAIFENSGAMLDAIYEGCRGSDAIVATFFGATFSAIAQTLDIPFFQSSYCLTDSTNDHCLPLMPQLPLGPAYNRATYRLAYRMISIMEKRYAHPWCIQNGVATRTMNDAQRYQINGVPFPIFYAFSKHIVPRAPEWPDNIRVTGFWEEKAPECTPSEALCEYLSGDDPPIYIGFGSMRSGDMQQALCMVLQALSHSNYRVLLSSGWGGFHDLSLPSNIHILHEYIPHRWLFDHVRAVVHHGGAGTTAAGLMAGKPTLIVPFGGDQFFWGERVHALGCGPGPLMRSHLRADRLSEKITALMSNPQYDRNAQKMKMLLADEDGACVAADCIESQMKGSS